jgi:hypothetical protein
MTTTFLVALTSDAPFELLGVQTEDITKPFGPTHRALRCSAVEWLPSSLVRLVLAQEEKNRVLAVHLHQQHILAILEGQDLPKSMGFAAETT